ncbi:MAG: hypothetical protein ACOC1F_12420, partial [Myxococcota bacterium]
MPDPDAVSFEVAGYRALRKVAWQPSRLSVLVGANGSGKSTLLSIPDFCASLSRRGASASPEVQEVGRLFLRRERKALGDDWIDYGHVLVEHAIQRVEPGAAFRRVEETIDDAHPGNGATGAEPRSEEAGGSDGADERTHLQRHAAGGRKPSHPDDDGVDVIGKLGTRSGEFELCRLVGVEPHPAIVVGIFIHAAQLTEAVGDDGLARDGVVQACWLERL